MPETVFERKMDAKLILSILAAGLMSFTGVVVETAMNITFPALMREFGVGTTLVQWVTTGYLLVLTLVIPVSAFLKRRFRMKSLFLFAVLVFIVGTVLCMLAPAFWVLLLGRLLQGVGTGIGLPLMFNIVLEQTPFDKMGLMMGTANMITMVAPAVGPALGGVIASTLGWRYIFAVLLPLLVISLVCGCIAIRQSSPLMRAKLDVPGYLCLGVTFIGLVFGCSLAGDHGWVSLPVLGLFAAAVILLVLYVFRARRIAQPLIDFSVFSNKCYVFGLFSQMAIAFILLGVGFIAPNHAQLSLGANAMAAGGVLLPGCILGAILNPIAGRVYDKRGAKLPLLLGAILAVAACAAFSLPMAITAIPTMLIIYLVLQGGSGFLTGNNMTNAMFFLPDRLKPDGNALFTTLQQLAGAVGTAIPASIVAAAQAADPENLAAATAVGSHRAFIALFVIALILLFCEFSAVRAAAREKR